METQAVKGGPHVPWERDELGSVYFHPVVMVMGGVSRREMGLSLSRTWPGTGIHVKDARGLGTRDSRIQTTAPTPHPDPEVQLPPPPRPRSPSFHPP